MEMYLNRLWSSILRDREISIEIRLFRLIILTVTLICILLVLPVNLLQDISPYVNLFVLLYSAATILLYIRSRNGHHHTVLFYLITILVLNLTWFLNGGSFGSVSNYFFAALLYLLFFFRGITRLVSFILLIINNCLLLVAEHYYPALTIPFKSSTDRLIDLNAGFSSSIITCALVFWVVVTTLEHELEDRKRAEHSLIESENKLWTTLQSTADGILAVDSTGRLLHANHRFMELWHIPAELIGAQADRALLDHVLDQLHDPDAFMKRVRELYDSNEVGVDTLAFKDGRVYERYSNPIMTNNLVTGRVWSFRDVTERKRAEEELKRKNADIEQFIYTASHDLRSPLVTVKTFTGFLEQDIKGGLHDRVAQDLQFIHNATDKMKLLLDELLEMSRVDRIETPPVKVLLSEVLAEAQNALAGVITERNVEIHLPEIDLVMFGDRPRISRIWQNLIENAIKYSREDTVPQIFIGIQDKDGETLFFIRDNGIGIDHQFRDKIFGIFEKLDPKSPGAGMGLSMILRIIERYGGRIWVESGGSGTGSCFYFTLPHAVFQE